MGCTFAPLTTVAMRDISPRMAGAASGVFNTTRQVGSVIGTAGVGALLQNRLLAALTSQAQPAHGRAARGGPASAHQRIPGRGQERPGGRLRAPADRPAEARSSPTASCDAMRPTMLMPIVILLIGAASCLLIRRGQHAPAGPRAEVRRGTRGLDRAGLASLASPARCAFQRAGAGLARTGLASTAP